MSNIVGRIGNYDIIAEQNGTFLVRRVGDELDWARVATKEEARREAQLATTGCDQWRQATRGTGLMPTDFGRMVLLQGEYVRIIGFVPAAREQKVITQNRKFRVDAFTVEEVLKALPKSR